MHDLGFCYENHSDGERFVILAILRVEKRWAKVKTSAIAYSSIVSAHFRIWTCHHHEATTLHGVTTLQASLTFSELRRFSTNDSITLTKTLNSCNGNSP